MSGTIKVPGISKPMPKPAVLGGLAVVGVGIVIYYRKHQGSATAAAGTAAAGSPVTSAAGTSAYPWDGSYGNPSDPYSQDPSTGLTYGNEGSAGAGGSGGSGGNAGGGLAGPPFSSNAAWSAYAIQQLTAGGANMAPIAEALGLYLDGKLLDAAQQGIAYQAEAVAGQVPVDGPGGYPPKLRTSGGGPGGSTHADNPVRGLHQTGGEKGTATIAWDKSAHAASYAVSVAGTAAGRATTSATSHTFRGLKAGHHTAQVLARPAAPGARPAQTSITVR